MLQRSWYYEYMNKYIRNLAIVLFLVLVVGFVFVLRGKGEAAPASSEKVDRNQAVSAPSTAQTASTGTYVDYASDKVARDSSRRILFFHASWCPQCRDLDRSISGGTIPSGVTIYKVDYDSNQALRQKYGVTLQTTLVLLDADSNVAKKYVAYDQPTLAALIENML